MKRFLISKKSIVGLLALAIIAMSAVGAYAYWSKGGSGTGTATTASNVNVVINQTPLAPGVLFPGGAPVALSGSFTSTNQSETIVGAVFVATFSVTMDPAILPPTPGAPFASNPNPCTTADFVITGTSPGPHTAPAASTGGSWTGLFIQMINSNQNQNACKNATVNITYGANHYLGTL